MYTRLRQESLSQLVAMKLLSLGRIGGAISIVVGGLLIWWTDYLMERDGKVFMVIPAIGAACCLYGLVLLVVGNPAHRPLKEPAAEQLPFDVEAKLRRQPRPYWLCTACREVSAGAKCVRCLSHQFTVHVVEPTDVELAIAAAIAQMGVSKR